MYVLDLAPHSRLCARDCVEYHVNTMLSVISIVGASLCTMNSLLTLRLLTRIRRRPDSQKLKLPSLLRAAKLPLGHQKISSRPAFISNNSDQAQHSAPVPKTWIDYMPLKTQPYLHLTRIDKPIGTLLLFYPCSRFRV